MSGILSGHACEGEHYIPETPASKKRTCPDCKKPMEKAASKHSGDTGGKAWKGNQSGHGGGGYAAATKDARKGR